MQMLVCMCVTVFSGREHVCREYEGSGVGQPSRAAGGALPPGVRRHDSAFSAAAGMRVGALIRCHRIDLRFALLARVPPRRQHPPPLYSGWRDGLRPCGLREWLPSGQAFFCEHSSRGARAWIGHYHLVLLAGLRVRPHRRLAVAPLPMVLHRSSRTRRIGVSLGRSCVCVGLMRLRR